MHTLLYYIIYNVFPIQKKQQAYHKRKGSYIYKLLHGQNQKCVYMYAT